MFRGGQRGVGFAFIGKSLVFTFYPVFVDLANEII